MTADNWLRPDDWQPAVLRLDPPAQVFFAAAGTPPPAPAPTFATVVQAIEAATLHLACHPEDEATLRPAIEKLPPEYLVELVTIPWCERGTVYLMRPPELRFGPLRLSSSIERSFDNDLLTPDRRPVGNPDDDPEAPAADGTAPYSLPSIWLPLDAWSGAKATLARGFVWRYVTRSRQRGSTVTVEILARRRYRVVECECDWPSCDGFSLLSDTPNDFDPRPGVAVADLFCIKET